MSANNELLDKLKQFLTEDEIKEGIEKGVIKVDIQKGEGSAAERMPFTEKSPGLESGTGPINQTTAGSASWEMVKTTIMKAIEGIEKANEMLSSYMEKADYKEDQDKDMEKAYGKMMSSADEMKKQMKMYKAKMTMNKSLDAKELENMKDANKAELEKLEKAFNDKLEKAFSEKLEGLSSKNEDLSKANSELVTQNQNLEKSVSTLTDQLGQLKSDMEKIGKETPAPKAVNYQAYIEKGGVKDNDGKKIYHVGMHRNQIINELEKAKAGLDDLEKAQVDEDILQYASAGIAPSEATSRMLYDKHNVKLVK